MPVCGKNIDRILRDTNRLFPMEWFARTDRGIILENSDQIGRIQQIRHSAHEVVFESETTAGKVFDILVLFLIGLSVIAVSLESVAEIEARFGPELRAAEWGFTILFTVEYLVRLSIV